MIDKIGTLKELNVKPGDVVECVEGHRHAKPGETFTINEVRDIRYYAHGSTDASIFRIISRASDEAPKLWRDMTDEEKGALLLAEHEGKVIECYQYDQVPSFWAEVMPNWADDCSFRIKPEPVRETVEMRSEGSPTNRWCFCTDIHLPYDTHRITFDTLDGEPDCASIKMEKL